MFKKIITGLFIDKEIKKDAAFLKDAVFFNNFTISQLKKILAIVYKKDYLNGEIIYDKNEDAKLFCILYSGEVELSNDKTKKNIAVNEVFGKMPLTGQNDLYSQTAKSIGKSRVWIIYKDALEELMNSDAKIGFKITKILLRNLHNGA